MYCSLYSNQSNSNMATSPWMFSKDYLSNHTPSRIDGISQEKEEKFRLATCSFIIDLGNCLKVYAFFPPPFLSLSFICKNFFFSFHKQQNSTTKYIFSSQQTVATACVYLHRFYARQSFKKHDRFVSWLVFL